MKKVLLAIFLLTTVILIGYVQVVRQQDQLKAAHDVGVKSSTAVLEIATDEVDSLRKAISDKELAFNDSLFQRAKVYQLELDSLSGDIDSLEHELAKTTKQLKSARAAAKNTSAKASTDQAAKSPTAQDQILAYYNQRYRNLPKDLSAYEQKIALNEIREETARKFSISVADLNRMRSDNKLDY